MTNQNQELKDTLENFKPKKLLNERAGDLMIGSNNYVSLDRLGRFQECGTLLIFLSDIEKNKHKLAGANFCRDRFCPMCQWRLALKNSYALSVMMRAMSDLENVKYIFVTLTAPNVKAGELEQEIRKYSKGFTALNRKINQDKTRTHGYVRKIEITYNQDRDDYHPHIHAIFAIKSTYFKPNYYLSRDDWLRMWQEVMKNDSITQVDVRRVKDLDKSVLEISKYAVKSQEFLYSQEVFDVFLNSLKGKRLISYGGMFKDYRTKFKDGKLKEYEEIDETEYIYKMMMKWQPELKDYSKVYALLTDDEKEELKNKK